MLISAECYRDMYLKNESEDFILGEVSTLLAEIKRLKYKMETPYYEFEEHPYPAEREQLAACRSYLEKAREELNSRSGDFDVFSIFSDEEKMREKLNGLKKISVVIGVSERYIATSDGEKFDITTEKDGQKREGVSEKQTLLHKLFDIRISEWRSVYLPKDYGWVEPSPMPWEVVIDFENGENCVTYSGISVYPYNFASFIEIFNPGV